MIEAPIPADDEARLAALSALEILDTGPEQEFDAIVKLAAEICGVPIALVSLVDESRQWFKAKVGLSAHEGPRALSFCGHAIAGEQTLVVPDASRDERFADNPARTGEPRVEFYAGVPLRLASGHNVGTLCVVDHVPRELSASQRAALESLGAHVVRLLELRRTAVLQRKLAASLQEGRKASSVGDDASWSDFSRRSMAWSRVALVLSCVILVSSVLASYWVHTTVVAASTIRLERATERAVAFLQERINAYGEILRGTGALFRGSDHVSQAELSVYVRALELQEHFPGLLGLGYAVRVPRETLGDFLASVTREQPDFQLVTSGDARDLVVNYLAAPEADNRAAVGFDIASEPVRARALAVSARTQDVAVTERVSLLQDMTHGPGFILYLPVPSRTEAHEPAGWVFAALRARDLVAGVASAAGDSVALRVIDDEKQAPLFGAIHPSEDMPHVMRVRFGDKWLRVEGRPAAGFYSTSELSEPWAILFLGIGATGLALALTRSLERTEARSRELALRMTAALRAANEELERLATTDALTGVANRRVFDERVVDEISRAKRAQTPLSIAMVDVDSFKLYNDAYGHPQGDTCLRQVAFCLRATAKRAGELAARYGGEEFVLVLPGSTEDAARGLCEALCERIRSLALPHERSAHGVVTVSVGVATLTVSDDVKSLVARADAALYRAKASGRNRAEAA